MNLIQTLYFDKSINPYQYHFGWAASGYHLMSWALSCLQLKHLYNQVDLYCNTPASILLINQLKLPYNNVYITHDNLKIADESLWALPKIFTYGLQDKPFLHVDGDVFLFDKLPTSLLDSELIAQNVEEATNYYLDTQQQLMKYFTYFPNCVAADFKSNIPIKAVNAGILGGNNIAFIKEYTNLAFEYIKKNMQHFSDVNTDRFNVFFEQHLFYSLAKEKKISIEVLIKDTIMDNQYQYLGNFHEVPCRKNYLHLLGQYKKDEHTCRQMALKLRELYPEYYFRILSLFKTKKIPLSAALSFDKNFTGIDEYTGYSNKAKQNYANSLYTDNSVKLSTSSFKNKDIQTLQFLKNFIDRLQGCDNFTRVKLEADYNSFSENLLKALKEKSKLKRTYIYGRDIDANSWFCELFSNEVGIPDKTIAKCKEVSIIKSTFDWAGLLNKHTRIGIKYYEELELNSGEFYNLVVPEIFGDGFTLQDIDEMEKIILDHLLTPLLIKDLFKLMHEYIEADIIANHLEEYYALIIVMLKQLVQKKAIRPIKVKSISID